MKRSQSSNKWMSICRARNLFHKMFADGGQSTKKRKIENNGRTGVLSCEIYAESGIFAAYKGILH